MNALQYLLSENYDPTYPMSMSTYCGYPVEGVGFEERYLIPALARVMGNTPEAWQAASWVVLSSSIPKGKSESARQYWLRMFSHARQELASQR